MIVLTSKADGLSIMIISLSVGEVRRMMIGTDAARIVCSICNFER